MNLENTVTTSHAALTGPFSLTADGADMPASGTFDVINPSAGSSPRRWR